MGERFDESWLESCGVASLSVTEWMSEAQLAALLAGRWIACTPNHAWRREEMIGVEYRADHSFTLLIRDADGRVALGSGIEYSGTWVFTDSGTGNGPLALGIQFDAEPSDGMWVSRPVFTEKPAQMKMGEILGTLVRPDASS